MFIYKSESNFKGFFFLFFNFKMVNHHKDAGLTFCSVQTCAETSLACNPLRGQMTRSQWCACKHRPAPQFVSSSNPSWSAVIYSLYPNSDRLATADGPALLLSGLKWHYDDLFSTAGVSVCVWACVGHLLLGVLAFLWMEMFTFFHLLPYFLQGRELGALIYIIIQLCKISNTINLILTTLNSGS